ncbi:MAG: type II toxin-antitoxin system PemK/MazF family toxin [Vicingaceae bacterium]|nr:type II toxin-antitoxin system PemK/MazF family toxin [Vicingaceae bacterium]
MELVQYQIVLVNLDPTIGSEIKKTRPCLIISPKELNKYLKTIVIAPLTSNLKSYPTRVLIHHNNQKGTVVLDQIRTIDRKRIVKILGEISHKEITQVKNILRETYVD